MRIKQNEDDCQTELWIDGEFHAGWSQIDVPEESRPILEAMLRYAVEHGKHLKADEIKKAIGV